MRPANRLAVAALAMLIVVATGHAGADDQSQERFRSIYKELVETNTTLSAGDCTLAAQRMSARLKTAGYRDEDSVSYTHLDVYKRQGTGSRAARGQVDRGDC